jgi:hypothetical protein
MERTMSMLNRSCIAALLVSLVLILHVYPRNLVVVDGTGETADWLDLDDSTVDVGVATLGLTPNDFLVRDSLGVCINSGSSDLYFFRMPDMTPFDSLFLGGNRNPYSGAWFAGDRILVTNWLISSVSEIDASSRILMGEYQIGVPAQNINHPQGIAVVGNLAFITMSCFNDEFVYFPGRVEVLDLDVDTTVARIQVGLNPQGIKFGRDGYLYVVCTGNYVDVFGILYKVDPGAMSVADSLAIGGQPGLIDITGQRLAWLAAGGWGPWTSGTPRSLPKAVSSASKSLGGVSDAGGIVYTVDLLQWRILRGPTNPIITDFGVVAVRAVSDSTVVTCNYQDGTVTELDSAGNILARFHTGDGPTAVAKYPDCFVPAGDADGNGIVNVSDGVFLIAYIFGGGDPPTNSGSGDADENGLTNISDAVYIIAYIFGGGDPPSGCAD